MFCKLHGSGAKFCKLHGRGGWPLGGQVLQPECCASPDTVQPRTRQLSVDAPIIMVCSSSSMFMSVSLSFEELLGENVNAPVGSRGALFGVESSMLMSISLLFEELVGEKVNAPAGSGGTLCKVKSSSRSSIS